MSSIIQIDIDNYLDEDDRKEIARDEFRSAMRRNLRTPNDLERFVGNSIYVAIWRELDDMAEDTELVESLRKSLRERLEQAIPEVSTYTVFARSDGGYLRTKDTIGAQLLDEILGESRDKVEARVHEVIGELDQWDIKSALKDHFSDILDGALKDEA